MDVKETDLRSITRDSDTCKTTVELRLGDVWDRGTEIKWLTFGRAQIRKMETDGFPNWRLAAYLKNATDFEHDSAFAFRLMLVALEFKFVENHCTVLQALVHPSYSDEFHVPRPGYNPLELPESTECPDCEEKHIIVPEGFYVPPFDAELFEAVAGKSVTIYIGAP